MTATAAPSIASTSTQRNNLLGVACGMGAGALWGLVFLAPELLSGFSPLELTIGRYLCYGLIAGVLLMPRWRSLVSRLPKGQWLNLAWLAFIGNILYYILLSNAVQIGGIAMTSLVIGFLPVAVTLIGSRDRDAVSIKSLLPSLLLGAAGVACIGWQALTQPASGSSSHPWIGLLCAVGALGSWTAFAVGNARCLKRLDNVSGHDWNLLTGIVTGAQAVFLIPMALLIGTARHDSSAWAQFGAVSLATAVLASIVGNALWNRMSRLLPLTLVGQMILFETLFALVYGFIWERRAPTLWELLALSLVVTSVLSCLTAHRKPVSI